MVEFINRNRSLMGLHYWPPNGQWELERLMFMKFAESCTNNRVILACDFNFHSVDCVSRARTGWILLVCS